VSGDLFSELFVTVSRGVAGIFWANVVGVILGVAAGLNARLCKLTAPLVAALQSCPPVVWITLVMVWAGTGAAVPVATVFAATLPFVFSTTAQGVMGLNRRVLAVSRLYAVPWRRVLLSYVLPGVLPYWLAGFSTVLATAWKSAAVAEFLGSHQGIGARIFWSYHKLEMEELHAWALALVMLGVFLECAVIAPLRRKAASMETRGSQSCSR
jgi:ABC-type nitrate/sulfonate/bicarbonate transport system permease component